MICLPFPESIISCARFESVRPSDIDLRLEALQPGRRQAAPGRRAVSAGLGLSSQLTQILESRADSVTAVVVGLKVGVLASDDEASLARFRIGHRPDNPSRSPRTW